MSNSFFESNIGVFVGRKVRLNTAWDMVSLRLSVLKMRYNCWIYSAEYVRRISSFAKMRWFVELKRPPIVCRLEASFEFIIL